MFIMVLLPSLRKGPETIMSNITINVSCFDLRIVFAKRHFLFASYTQSLVSFSGEISVSTISGQTVFLTLKEVLETTNCQKIEKQYKLVIKMKH